MNAITCKWVEDHLDALEDDKAAAELKEMLHVHLAVCPNCAESARLWAGLKIAASSVQLDPIDPMRERRLVSGTAPEPIPRRLRPGIKIAMGSVAATLVALLIAAGLLANRELESGQIPNETKSTAPLAWADEIRGVDAQGLATKAQTIAEETDSSGRRGIHVIAGTTLWLSQDASVQIAHSGTDGVWFELARGEALADIGPTPDGFRFVVVTPEEEIEARGTVFRVNVEETGRSRVRVAEGTVEVRSRKVRQAPKVVAAGQETASDSESVAAADPKLLRRDLGELDPEPEPTPQAVTAVAGVSPDPAPMGHVRLSKSRSKVASRPEGRSAGTRVDTLFKQAQTERRERNFRSAALTYRTIIEKHSGSAAALNSLVALGQLELSALEQPRSALNHFEQYLDEAPSGELAAEARVGQVRALARLGSTRQILGAIDAYFNAHPAGRARAEMHRRLGDALASSGKCDHAVVEYRKVVEQWSGTREARRAQAGLDACDAAQ